jgi:hypothetical protein
VSFSRKWFKWARNSVREVVGVCFNGWLLYGVGLLKIIFFIFFNNFLEVLCGLVVGIIPYTEGVTIEKGNGKLLTGWGKTSFQRLECWNLN